MPCRGSERFSPLFHGRFNALSQQKKTNMSTLTEPQTESPSEAPEQPGKTPEKAYNSLSIRIGGDVVNRATADLPDEQRGLIRWLHDYGVKNGLTLDEVGKLVHRDRNTIYQVFTGRHGAAKTAICEEIERVKKLAEAREGIGQLSFIETALTRKIWRLCDSARAYQRVVFVFSDSQIGKTTALKEYTRRNNHGTTIYSSLPAGGNLGNYMRSLAHTLRIPAAANTRDLRERVTSAFDSRMLLIVDEAHQCFLTAGKCPRGTAHLLSLEFIREIFDASGCGLVICGTHTFRREMDNGFASGWLTQLSRRRLAALNIRPTPANTDLDTFAAAYGLPPAEGETKRLQDEVIASEALGVWLTLLRMAAGIAAKRKQPMTWEHVALAHAARAKLEA